MNKDEAQRRLAEFLRRRQDGIGYLPSAPWFEAQPEFHQVEGGHWLASYPELPREGILLKSDGTTFAFFGALGKLVPLLGWRVAPACGRPGRNLEHCGQRQLADHV